AAATGAKKGISALEEIAKWTEVRFSEADLPEQRHRTIDGNWAHLLLPIAYRVAARKEKKTVQTSAPPPARPIPETGHKILVVDDTELLLVFVADILSTFDPSLQIATAATGAEGLRLARELQPDLILLDYSLTDTTGDQVCRQLLA